MRARMGERVLPACTVGLSRHPRRPRYTVTFHTWHTALDTSNKYERCHCGRRWFSYLFFTCVQLLDVKREMPAALQVFVGRLPDRKQFLSAAPHALGYSHQALAEASNNANESMRHRHMYGKHSPKYINRENNARVSLFFSVHFLTSILGYPYSDYFLNYLMVTVRVTRL
jgi:hypothetical protein